MRTYIVSLFTLLAISLSSQAADKPNIVVILADDLRADCIGAVNPRIHTPNIDRLAKRGVMFSNCYGMGADGPGVCLPSRVMIMSGRSLFHLPVDYAAPDKPVVKPSVPVMPTVMRAAGYDTFYCGKTSNTYRRANAAFDEHVAIDIKAGINRDNGKELALRRGFANPVVSYIGDAARAKKPFFVFYAPGTPHDPLYCEPECMKLYRGDNLPPLPPNAAVSHGAFAGFEQHDTNPRSYEVPGLGEFKTPLKLEQWRDIIGQYYAMVSSFDLDVGRILDELERTGAIKNTIIIFASDNGLSLSDHGLIHKSSLYEHDIKLPLIVCGPGIPEGKHSDAFVYLSDMFPTLCQMIGVPIPETVQTQSYLPSVLDPGKAARKTMYFAYTEEMRAFREDQYKVILYSNHRVQLFDLKADPFEMRDLSKDPAHAERLTRLIDQARAAGKSMDDVAGKKVTNIYRPWPQTTSRLAKDGPMLWEVWKME